MERITNRDLLKFSFLSSPRFSPDGKKAALVVSHCDEGENRYLSDLWLLKDGAVRQLTSGGDAKSFLWEDDDTLLFPACRDKAVGERLDKGEKRTVYQRIRIDGGEAREAFSIPLSVQRMEPLGDGRYALLASVHPDDPDFSALEGPELEAYFARVKREKDYQVLEEIPFWHNGGGFSNRVRSRLYIFDPAGGSLVPITDPATQVGVLRADREGVLFSAKPFTGKMQLTDALCRYDLASGTVETLLPDGRYAIDEVFRLGGQALFMGTDMAGGVMDFRQNSVFFRVENGQAGQFYDGDEEPGGTCGSDCRYGGGQGIVQLDGEIWYKAASHTGTVLKRLLASGKAETLLTREGSIDSFDVRDGKLLFIGMEPTALQEVYTGLEQTRVSAFNAWVGRERLIAQPVPVTYAGEGGPIEGFYLKPAGWEAGKRYPAILDIHGGPRTAYGSAFFHEMQSWAGAGYYVLYCNPRGSDGRGEAFADIRGKYGTIDYDDLMGFTDEVLSLCPEIDPQRLGVTGGSYGGFMTNWIIGHTRRFRCAVSQRSISNWISKFNTTDIGYYFNAMQNKSTPWDNCDKLWWHSPLKYADRAVTPTLFIHSDEDYRCWMGEGLQMFTALRYHGVEARLCLFHGENHELSRSGKPLHRLRRLEEMLAWFDRYLKAD